MTPEIRAFEFSLGLFSVLIGLAIADVAASFHRLIGHRQPVRWDPLTLLAALFSLIIAVGMWFDLWGIRKATSVRHFFAYLGLVAMFFVLFLAAASSLPDEAEGPLDLRDHYERNRRYFWSLITIFELVYVALGVHFLMSEVERVPRVFIVIVVAQWAVLVVTPAMLALVRSRGFHYVGLALLYLAILAHYAPYSIN